MFCNQCGTPLQPGSSVCARCGATVIAAPPVAAYSPGIYPMAAAIPAGSIPLPSSLSAAVAFEVLKLPYQQQIIFVDEYRRRSKELAIAYLFLICLFSHYAYLGRWGLQVAFWLTAGGAGIWWLVDIFRLPGVVRQYNDWVALDLLQQTNARIAAVA